MNPNVNADPAELAKFSDLAHRWWDTESEFRPLHQINPLRLEWIHAMVPLTGKKVLDVGCGGGILADAMARKGASVTGIDLAGKALKVAQLHALEAQTPRVQYREISAEALAITAAKQNVRVLQCGALPTPSERIAGLDYKRVNGGLLVQDADLGMIGESDLKIVTKRAPTEAEIHDLIFAWKVAKYVKSNAIVYAKNRQTVGVGAGQMSRVNSARIAAIKAEHAGLQVAGSVMASDAFFPFRDGIDNAAKVGISCVIQPGGSMRDAEVIAAADEVDDLQHVAVTQHDIGQIVIVADTGDDHVGAIRRHEASHHHRFDLSAPLAGH